MDDLKFKMIRKSPAILPFFCGLFIGLIPVFTSWFQLPQHRDNMVWDNMIPCNPRDGTVEHLKRTARFRSKSSTPGSNQRKILLDCGANVASTIRLFLETYPGGDDFQIHSFEIDDRLAPYFAPYDGVHLHCPVGVANKTGGQRHLSHRKQIPVIDLSQWIQDNTTPNDYVIFKLDVEGAEFDILEKMLKDGTFKWIDKMYGEYHYSQPHGWDKAGRDRIKDGVKKQGFEEVDWAGEQRDYGDFEAMYPIHVSDSITGRAGVTYTKCKDSNQIAIGVAVGMNYKRAQWLIDTIDAYPVKVPVTLFFYGDFVQQFPDAVLRWSQRFDIGIREDSHYPLGHFETMASKWIRAALVGAELKFRNIGIQPGFYLPTNISMNVVDNAKARGWRIVKPAAVFPPPLSYPEDSFDRQAYYSVRDVERIPKGLRVIHEQLVAPTSTQSGGILVLDSDLPDSLMNVVFLLDYLVKASQFKLLDIATCVS